MLSPGIQLELTIESAAAGGRMIARHDGLVLLVSGAVPGERVLARVERVERKVAFAAVTDVREPSPDRRDGFPDPLCGGCVYSHIAYPRQLDIKADVIRQAFVRIGRIPLSLPIPTMPSPERGHRMRARLHVRDGRAGFFREGTHVLCDAAQTGQLTADALAAIQLAVRSLEDAGSPVLAVELAENVPGDTRVLAIEVPDAAKIGASLGSSIVDRAALAGLIVIDSSGRRRTAGETSVGDTLARLTRGRAAQGELHRQPESFFQANRFLVSHLVDAVLDAIPSDGPVLDLYSGVGLFAVSLAATGRRDITAVEGDRASGADLQRNAGPFGDAVTIVREAVEGALRGPRQPAGTIIVDPPRTGVSSEALEGILRMRAGRIVYVSCDPATLARDARKLLDARYRLESVRAFDFFPNTPHVEALAVFVLGGA